MAFSNTSSGGYYRPPSFGGFSFFPPVIKWLLITNGAIWLLTAIVLRPFNIGGDSLVSYLVGLFALWPVDLGFSSLTSFWPWQLVTYTFLHADFWHVFFNMLMLWMFGMEIENLWGSRKFLIFYLLSGVAGGLANLLITAMMGSVFPTIGASGAVFGVLIAFGMLFPNRPVYLYFLLPIPAKWLIAGMVGINLFYGVFGGGGNVAYFAHLGGAAFGFLYMLGEMSYIPTKNWWTNIREAFSGPPARTRAYRGDQVKEGKFYDIQSGKQIKKEQEVTQEVIDAILDKISTGGYQNLSAEEKRILNEASRKIH